MQEIIYMTIQLVVAVVCFMVGKYVFPKIPVDVWENFCNLSEWATAFVVWAKEFCKDKTGPEKMDEVIKQLQRVANDAGITVTEDQLKAIAQKAYEAMKAGELEAEAQILTAEPVQTTPVIINITSKDEVQVEELEEKPAE